MEFPAIEPEFAILFPGGGFVMVSLLCPPTWGILALMLTNDLDAPVIPAR
jgi:hypothetical protein